MRRDDALCRPPEVWIRMLETKIFLGGKRYPLKSQGAPDLLRGGCQRQKRRGAGEHIPWPVERT